MWPWRPRIRAHIEPPPGRHRLRDFDQVHTGLEPLWRTMDEPTAYLPAVSRGGQRGIAWRRWPARPWTRRDA